MTRPRRRGDQQPAIVGSEIKRGIEILIGICFACPGRMAAAAMVGLPSMIDLSSVIDRAALRCHDLGRTRRLVVTLGDDGRFLGLTAGDQRTPLRAAAVAVTAVLLAGFMSRAWGFAMMVVRGVTVKHRPAILSGRSTTGRLACGTPSTATFTLAGGLP